MHWRCAHQLENVTKNKPNSFQLTRTFFGELLAVTWLSLRRSSHANLFPVSQPHASCTESAVCTQLPWSSWGPYPCANHHCHERNIHLPTAFYYLEDRHWKQEMLTLVPVIQQFCVHVISFSRSPMLEKTNEWSKQSLHMKFHELKKALLALRRILPSPCHGSLCSRSVRSSPALS